MKKISVAVFFLSGLTLLGASGGSDSAGSAATEISIMSGTITESPEGDVEQAIADEYMRLNPNVAIKFIPVPSNDHARMLTTWATSGDLPDGFAMSAEFAPNMMEMNVMADIRQYLDDEYYNGFFKSVLDEITINGVMTRFPWFSIPAGVIYRTDWLEEAGMDIPTNWDEFQKAAIAMTKDTNNDGSIDQWGFSMVGTNNGSGQSRFMMIARTFGMDDAVFSNGKWSTGIAQPEFVSALKFFTELYTVHGVVPPGPTEASYPEAVNYLATEKTGLMVTGSNGMGLVLNRNPSLNGKLGSFQLPMGTRNSAVINIGGFSISADTPNAELVIDYLKFLVNKENAENFASQTGRLPVRKDATESELFTLPTYKGFVDALDAPYLYTPSPKHGEMLVTMGEAYTDIMANGVSLDDAVTAARQKEAEMMAEINN